MPPRAPLDSQALAKELVEVKRLVEKLATRIELLERGLATKPVAKNVADEILLPRSYRVTDFVPAAPYGDLQLHKLKHYITTHIAPQQWEGAGGEGAVRVYEQNLSLVIKQTEEVHAEIARRLAQPREAKTLLREFDETPTLDPPLNSTVFKGTREVRTELPDSR